MADSGWLGLLCRWKRVTTAEVKRVGAKRGVWGALVSPDYPCCMCGEKTLKTQPQSTRPDKGNPVRIPYPLSVDALEMGELDK